MYFEIIIIIIIIHVDVIVMYTHIYLYIFSVRKEILNILQLPTLLPELFPVGSSRRRGILLYGPPGIL